MLSELSQAAQELNGGQPTRHRTSRPQTQKEAPITDQSVRPDHSYFRNPRLQPTVTPQEHLPSRPNSQVQEANTTGGDKTSQQGNGTQDATTRHSHPPEDCSNVGSTAMEVVLPHKDNGLKVYQTRSGFVSPTSEIGKSQQETIVLVTQSIKENIISIRKAQELGLPSLEREEKDKEEGKRWMQWVVTEDGLRSKVIGIVEAYWWPGLSQGPHRTKLRLWVCEYLEFGIILGKPFIDRERHGE